MGDIFILPMRVYFSDLWSMTTLLLLITIIVLVHMSIFKADVRITVYTKHGNNGS